MKKKQIKRSLSETGKVQRTVLVLMSMGYMPQFDGVVRYARSHDWRLIPINCLIRNGKLLHADTQKPLRIDDLRSAWNPAGIIVDYAAASIVFALWGKSDLPLVFPDHRTSDIGPKAACVSGNSEIVAQTAARELFSLGYAHYAFVPNSGTETSWCRERSAAFRTAIHEAGSSFHLFQPESGEGPARKRQLKQWLGKIPKPCGIFAANDYAAQEVKVACQDIGLRIPEDIALVGVDNHPEICEAGTPTLTSIQQDLEDCYYQSAKLLDALIDNPKSPCRTATFGVSRIVRRASTRPLKAVDIRVKAALEFIRLHAAERLTPADVVSAMGCRRSFADQRFRECTGRSIVEEISLRRVELVKDALKNPEVRLDDLPQVCGFASAVDMRRVFKKLTGLSPREWRKSNANSISRLV